MQTQLREMDRKLQEQYKAKKESEEMQLQYTILQIEVSNIACLEIQCRELKDTIAQLQYENQRIKTDSEMQRVNEIDI